MEEYATIEALIERLVGNLGVPVAMIIFLMIYMFKIGKSHRESIQALRDEVKAMQESVKSVKESLDKLNLGLLNVLTKLSDKKND